MELEIRLAYDNNREIKKLFLEYTEMLVKNDSSFAKYLELQNYDSELEHLKDKYGLPDGRLYIVKVNNEVAGCIALRKIDCENCEMKRLYVRPAFRGHKIANKLVEIIIEDAKRIGYKSMLLDTLPFLEGAIHLYRKFGFYEIESYNNSPMDTSIYMKLDLLNEFLEKSEYIDYESELIISKAQWLFNNNMTNVEKAQTAYLFVRDEIPHSFDCSTWIITATASDVLKYKTGICHAKANLLAALLRSQGIPTGFCFQHLTLMDDDSKGYCLHCYNAIMLDNKWIKVDARGNTKGINAQFSMDAPILAFENRPQYDEYFFDGIFAKPDLPTMEILKFAETIQDVIDGLPEKPFGSPSIHY